MLTLVIILAILSIFFFITTIKFYKRYNREKELSSLLFSKYEEDFKKILKRKDHYKKLYRDVVVTAINYKVAMKDMEIDLERLRDEKLRCWDVPDSL